MARPQAAALHDHESSPRAAHFSRRGAAALHPSALESNAACSPRAAEQGRATSPSSVEVGEPAGAATVPPVPGAARRTTDSVNAMELPRVGAKRGPKPALGRLVILPSQFYDGPQQALKMPECRLMLAILADAVECFQKYRSSTMTRQRALFAEARGWLMTRTRNERAKPDRDKQFSFDYVCDVLDLDAEAIRQHLETWERRQHDSSLEA